MDVEAEPDVARNQGAGAVLPVGAIQPGSRRERDHEPAEMEQEWWRARNQAAARGHHPVAAEKAEADRVAVAALAARENFECPICAESYPEDSPWIITLHDDHKLCANCIVAICLPRATPVPYAEEHNVIIPPRRCPLCREIFDQEICDQAAREVAEQEMYDQLGGKITKRATSTRKTRKKNKNSKKSKKSKTSKKSKKSTKSKTSKKSKKSTK
jgi:hypothetical protein